MQKLNNKKDFECEFRVLSPSGHEHCVADGHVDWKMRDGCKAELCPLSKFDPLKKPQVIPDE